MPGQGCIELALENSQSHFREELWVVKDQPMGIEDRGLAFSQAGLHQAPSLLDFLRGGCQRALEAVPFLVRVFRRVFRHWRRRQHEVIERPQGDAVGDWDSPHRTFFVGDRGDSLV